MPDARRVHGALLERGIVSIVPRQPSGRRLQVNVALQDDFSLHQALSIYLIDTLQKLDRESPDYALDVLTLAESIVDTDDMDLTDQLRRYMAWRRDGYLSSNGRCFDIGNTTRAALAARLATRPAADWLENPGYAGGVGAVNTPEDLVRAEEILHSRRSP